MYRKHIGLKVGLATGLLFLSFGQTALPQKKNVDSAVLADFEKSLQQGVVDKIDRPLVDYAIANPNNPKALELLARLRLRQGRFTESKALYQRVLRLDPTSVSAKINSGRIAFALGQKEEARQFLAQIEETASLAPSVRLELAAAMFLVGETRTALRIADTLPVDIRNTNGLPLFASIYLELGRRDELGRLIPLMTKAVMKNPVLAVPCAEVLQNAGLYKEGIALLRSLSPTAQNNAKVLVLLGRLEALVKDFASARAHLKKAAILEPRSADVLSAQAFLESSTGNITEALKLITKAREIAPSSSAVLVELVVLAMRSNQPQLAIDAAKALMAMEPQNPEFEYLFGAASLQGGDVRSAQEALERFVQKRPRDSRGCLALGLTLSAQRDQIENARKQLNHCIEFDPANFEARYQLGLSYKSEGENKQAVPLLEGVIEQVPNYASALRDLGALYLETGEDSKARVLLERAVTLGPQDADTHFQLIRLYNRIGENALAKQHLEIFRKLKGPWGKTAQ